MDFKLWEEIFRSLREDVESRQIKGYRFGDFTLMDPESFKVDTSKSILKFSDLEKVLDDEELANEVKVAVQKIFVEKSYSRELIHPLVDMEDFCARQAVESVALTKEMFFEAIKESTLLDTDREVEIYLNEFLNKRDGGLFIVEPKKE